MCLRWAVSTAATQYAQAHRTLEPFSHFDADTCISHTLAHPLPPRLSTGTLVSGALYSFAGDTPITGFTACFWASTGFVILSALVDFFIQDNSGGLRWGPPAVPCSRVQGCSCGTGGAHSHGLAPRMVSRRWVAGCGTAGRHWRVHAAQPRQPRTYSLECPACTDTLLAHALNSHRTETSSTHSMLTPPHLAPLSVTPCAQLWFMPHAGAGPSA